MVTSEVKWFPRRLPPRPYIKLCQLPLGGRLYILTSQSEWYNQIIYLYSSMGTIFELNGYNQRVNIL